MHGGDTLDLRQHMIIDKQKNRIITSDIKSCSYNSQRNGYDIAFSAEKTFTYGINRIAWLKNPTAIDPALYHVSHNGKELFGIESIYVFSDGDEKYWHICFKNGSERDYFEKNLELVKSCMDDNTSKNVFEYLSRMAELSDLKDDKGRKILPNHYKKLSEFIGDNTALAAYLNPKYYVTDKKEGIVPIFPFGCNASQYKAVKDALENQISIIQGPPGTGKTQTILNIIANLLISEKTIQIVSNNESAITNILEKLSSDKYGMGFLVALLGKSENKNEFITNQTGDYPDFLEWNYQIDDENKLITDINELSEKLREVFEIQERLSVAKQEIQAVKTEQQHFNQYSEESNGNLIQYKIRNKVKSKVLMRLWHECQAFLEKDKKVTLIFKLKSWIFYGVADWKSYKSDVSQIINMFQSLYYITRAEELKNEIDVMENELTSKNAKEMAEELEKVSMIRLKHALYRKYGGKTQRHKFSEDDLWQSPKEFQTEYPIVLSTTFSSRSSLSKDAVYDYLIMDEASQVDIATGALALSSARNAVIVGDTKQLPNIVDKATGKISDAIFDSFKIDEAYRFSSNSFLQSMSKLIKNVPQTLLREHYRCHPKIINFCNHKFYNGELLVMTQDNDEENAISVIKTVAGNHERDKTNQRQIDSVVQEVLPKIEYGQNEIGVIAPYNNQVNALKVSLMDTEIDVATVHKFQGREKDAVIITTVDDEITEFTDDPYLLNVAVSRAKKQLYLVTSGNEQRKDSNISDLISYIEYNNFEVSESKIYSVFDYLYKQYTDSRREYLKKQSRISEYDSENLMYVLVKDIFEEYGLTYLEVACHIPLKMIIRDMQLLNDEECRYAMNDKTHVDFLIYNRITKKPVLVIEVDGYSYHKDGTLQAQRDIRKNHILDLYELPYIRFATNGSREKEKIVNKLKDILKV